MFQILDKIYLKLRILTVFYAIISFSDILNLHWTKNNDSGRGAAGDCNIIE